MATKFEEVKARILEFASKNLLPIAPLVYTDSFCDFLDAAPDKDTAFFGGIMFVFGWNEVTNPDVKLSFNDFLEWAREIEMIQPEKEVPNDS